MNVSFDQMTAVAGGVRLTFISASRAFGLCNRCSPAAAAECVRLKDCACTPLYRKDQANGYWKEAPHG